MDKQTLLKSSTSETSVPINEWEVVSPGEFPTSATHADTPANFEDWVKAYPGEIGRSFTPVLEQKEGPATKPDATDSWIKAAARTVVKIPSLIKSGVLMGVKGMASGMESRATASAEMYEDVAATAGDKDYVPPLQRELSKLPGFEMTEEELKEQGALYRSLAEKNYEKNIERAEQYRTKAAQIEKFKERLPESQVQAENLFEEVVQGMSVYAPGALAHVTAGPLLGFASLSMTSQGMMYDEMRAAGVPNDEAFDISMMAGHLVGAIELSGIGFTLGQAGKIAARTAMKTGVSKTLADTVARGMAVVGAGALEEYVQSYPEAYVKVAADNPGASAEELGEKFSEFIKTPEARAMRKRSLQAGALGGALFAGPPVAYRGVKEGTAVVKQRSRSRALAKEGKDARRRLIDAYYRGESLGEGGLAKEHPLAQYNMDLYNKLYQPKGSIFEQMQVAENKRRAKEGAVLKRAKDILEKRGEKVNIDVGEAVERPAPIPKPGKKERVQEEQDLSTETVRRKDGEAFKSKPGAMAVRRRLELEESHEVVGNKEEGFELRPRTPPKAAEPEIPDVIVRRDGWKFKTKSGAMAVRRRMGLEDAYDVVGDKESGFELRVIVEGEEALEAEAAEEAEAETQKETPAPEPSVSNATVEEPVGVELLNAVLEEAAALEEHEDGMTETGNEKIDKSINRSNKIYSNLRLDELEAAKDAGRVHAYGVLQNGSLAEKLALVDDCGTLEKDEAEDLKDLLRMEESGETANPDVAAFKESLIRAMLLEPAPDHADVSAARTETLVQSKIPAELSLPKHFDSNPTIVQSMLDSYEELGWKKIQSNPETFTGYLINQVNAWVHGIAEPDIGRIKETLGKLRDEGDNLYQYFGSEVRLVGFLETLDKAIELTDKASEIRKGINPGATFRMSFGPDLLYPAFQEVRAVVNKWRGKVRAKKAWRGLTKVVSKEELAQLGIEEQLILAQREGRKISQDEVMNWLSSVPNASVEVRPVRGSVVDKIYTPETQKTGQVQEEIIIKVPGVEPGVQSPITMKVEVERTGDGFTITNFQNVMGERAVDEGVAIAGAHGQRAFFRTLAEVVVKRALTLGYTEVRFPSYAEMSKKVKGLTEEGYTQVLMQDMGKVGGELVGTPSSDFLFKVSGDPKQGIGSRTGFEVAGRERLKKKEGKKTQRVKGSNVNKMYREASKASTKSKKAAFAELKRTTQANLYDVTAPLKDFLNQAFGRQEARTIINQLILAKGHSVRASRFLSRAVKSIYGGLGVRERKILNEVIFSSRLIQIGRYKRNISDFKGMSPQNHRDFLTNLEEIKGISEAKASEIFRRAEIYFDHTHDLLKLLNKEGLITQEEFDKMEKFGWTRTEMLNLVDPLVSKGSLTAGMTKEGVTNRSSGIQDLEMGDETNTPQTDMMYVLADWTNRVMRRVHIARMNKELWDSAVKNPKNGMLIPGGQGMKRPPDWKTLEMIVEGKKRAVYAPPEFARWWHLDASDVGPGFANLLRLLSGSALLRPMATGYRLGFIPVNMIKDMTLMWHAAKYLDGQGEWQPVYNIAAPVALGQMAWDAGKVATSAVIRGKKYDKYIDAGGGHSFLAVQGRPFESAKLTERYGRQVSSRLGRVRGGIDGLFEALGYLNETSEILTRLMLVESTLRQIATREGKTLKEVSENEDLYREAASVAKDYLDFSQHGQMVKGLDQMIPYLNAKAQVGRTYLRAWKRDWKTAAIQHAQVSFLGALMYGAAKFYMGDDEGDDITNDIGAWEWANNFIIFPFGKEMYYETPNGEKVYPYVKIPVDGALAVPKAIGEIAAAYMTGQEMRGDVLREALKSAASMGTTTPFSIPIVSAWSAYAYGLDSFFGGRIWPYDDSVPYGERIIPGETPQFFIDMAEMLEKIIPTESGVSAHHLTEATKKIFTNGTYFTHLAGKAYEGWRDVPQGDREVALGQALAKFPTTKGLVGMTRPGASRYEALEESEQEIAKTIYIPTSQVRYYGKQYVESKAGERKTDAEGIRRKAYAFIRKQKQLSEDQRNDLYDLMSFYTDTPRMPHFHQWERLQGKNVRTRAREFYHILNQYEKGSDKWNEVWEEVQLFPSIATKDFWAEYEQIVTGEVTEAP